MERDPGQRGDVQPDWARWKKRQIARISSSILNAGGTSVRVVSNKGATSCGNLLDHLSSLTNRGKVDRPPLLEKWAIKGT